MKLIDEKGFLEELFPKFKKDPVDISVLLTEVRTFEDIREALAKHTRPLPKKKTTVPSQVENKMQLDINEGYNSCLSDCEKK